MRRALGVGFLALLLVWPAVAGTSGNTDKPAAADDEGSRIVTEGEFAGMLLAVLATSEPSQVPKDPEVALEQAKMLKLVPDYWVAKRELVQGELEKVLRKLCRSDFLAVRPKQPVSYAFATAVIRRHFECLKDYLGRVTGHGRAEGLLADEGFNRAVSPSEVK